MIVFPNLIDMKKGMEIPSIPFFMFPFMHRLILPIV